MASDDKEEDEGLLLLLPGNWKWPRLRAFGDARGDEEGEQGWVICMFSRCCWCGWCGGPAGGLLKLMLCGGEAGPLLRVSSAKGGVLWRRGYLNV